MLKLYPAKPDKNNTAYISVIYHCRAVISSSKLLIFVAPNSICRLSFRQRNDRPNSVVSFDRDIAAIGSLSRSLYTQGCKVNYRSGCGVLLPSNYWSNISLFHGYIIQRDGDDVRLCKSGYAKAMRVLRDDTCISIAILVLVFPTEMFSLSIHEG